MSKKVSDILPKTEILAQLAEEASELAQAALKLRRAINGENTTPRSISECEAALDEEIADVWLCIREVGFSDDEHLIIQGEIMSEKHERWLSRLNARKDV